MKVFHFWKKRDPWLRCSLVVLVIDLLLLFLEFFKVSFTKTFIETLLFFQPRGLLEFGIQFMAIIFEPFNMHFYNGGIVMLLSSFFPLIVVHMVLAALLGFVMAKTKLKEIFWYPLLLLLLVSVHLTFIFG